MKRRQELGSGRKPIRQLFAIITLLLQAYDSNRSIIHNHDYPVIVRQSHSLIRVTQRAVSMLQGCSLLKCTKIAQKAKKSETALPARTATVKPVKINEHKDVSSTPH